LTPDARRGAYNLSFRDLPEAITWGQGIEDALWQAADCLEEVIAGRIRRGDSISSSSRAKRGERLVPVPAITAAKAALYLAMREAKIDPPRLAQRLKRPEKEVRSLLDPRRATRLSEIEDALRALGKNLTLTVDAAA